MERKFVVNEPFTTGFQFFTKFLRDKFRILMKFITWEVTQNSFPQSNTGLAVCTPCHDVKNIPWQGGSPQQKWQTFTTFETLQNMHSQSYRVPLCQDITLRERHHFPSHHWGLGSSTSDCNAGWLSRVLQDSYYLILSLNSRPVLYIFFFNLFSYCYFPPFFFATQFPWHNLQTVEVCQ